ncbi:MAG: hypothetical protein ICV84_16665 [Flavisolibacter sp.]|nr:hypothetical protein [Flavisolibacter sp.]
MIRITLLAIFAGLLVTGCRKIEVDGTDNSNNNSNPGDNLILSGRISTDRTLKAGNTYKLRGIVYVVDGAKLTIEPGVTIQGEKSSRGTLVITRGTQILANGTANQPIVFTSDAGANAQRGDWGGVVITGRARTNSSFNGAAGVGEIEGGVNNAEGLGLYGGADDNDNSGVLKYVRIEYAGYAFLPDKELNGLTLAAVGRGTTIDHVQVSYAADDSFEWFGGTVDCKYLIAYKGLDDDWDMDNGYSGRLQFGISLRDSMIADVSQSNGFEIDNDAGGSHFTNGLPQTSATVSNFTVVGPRATLNNTGNTLFRRGIHTRRNSAISIMNSIVMGWPTGWNLDAGTGRPTDLNYVGTSPAAFVSNTILAGNNTPFTYSASTSQATGWTTTDLLNYFNRAGAGNSVLTNTTDAGLIAPFKYDNSVDWNPTTGSPAASGASFTNSKLEGNFFTQVTYRGACAVGDTWWKGWTRFF